MAWQSFRGAGGAGAVSVQVNEEQGFDRYGELDAPGAGSPLGALRELVTEIGSRIEQALARGSRIGLD